MNGAFVCVLILLTGCPNTRNPGYCEVSSDCKNGFVCNPMTHGCEEGGSDGGLEIDAAPTCASLIAFSRSDGLYTIKPDGSGLHGLASGQSERNPIWSPDGTRLLFERQADGAKDIFSINADGTGLANLTAGAAGDDFDPAWSPDGQYIAFTTTRNYTTGETDVFVMQADGRMPVMVDVKAGSATWSADSGKVAYASFKSGRFQIYVANRDGSNSSNITMSNFADTQPRWSPDGTKILFSGNRGGIGAAIYRMDPDGSNQAAFVPSVQANSNPHWSRDSSRVVFDGIADPVNDPQTDVYIADASGANVVNLTPGVVADDSTAAWSADGRQLVFVSTRDGSTPMFQSELYRVNDDATGPLRLTMTDFFSEGAPAWAPCP